jgi:AAHS family 3-hydroxyphenylpropionic acid transporter
LGLCFVAAVYEGIDLQSMGVAAPGVAAEFKLAPGLLGIIGSASSVGLFLGALLGGVLSDRVGRRLVMLSAVSLFGVFSIVTAWTTQPNTLILVRFLTGLGLGGGLPMIIAMAAEAANPARRASTVTMMYCATPIGGILASGVAWLAAGNWRLIFYVGGIAPLLLLPLMLARLRDAPRPPGTGPEQERMNVAQALFGEGRAGASLLLWLSFFGSVLVLYLLLNWLPLLLIGKGFSREQASIAQMSLNLGGACGALLLGAIVRQSNRRGVLLTTYAAGIVSLLALAAITGRLGAAAAASFVAGLYSQGAVFVLYGLAATYYRTAIRGTGVGWAVAFGRLGSIAGPVLAGLLVAAGRSPAEVLRGLLPIVVATGVVMQLLLFYREADESH